MKSKRKINESLSDMAVKVDHEHEVDLARSDLYQIADQAIKLHDILKSFGEEDTLDTSVRSKITKVSSQMDEIYQKISVGGIDELNPSMDDMDIEMNNMDIEMPSEIARQMESKKYNSVTSLKEYVDYENSLNSILYDGFSKIEKSRKK